MYIYMYIYKCTMIFIYTVYIYIIHTDNTLIYNIQQSLTKPCPITFTKCCFDFPKPLKLRVSP